MYKRPLWDHRLGKMFAANDPALRIKGGGDGKRRKAKRTNETLFVFFQEFY